ncbi:DEKNAAC102667 [Brettanomyces naardenensis]|uniref:DEKNAAC102667 n=1 Tax=Brettanomyces naardenensis TaxID=13370 RepID=A0A448YK94_BRENA|nr:DEKNAAC102667 [Brettanomyces naardenensis]
MVKNRRVPLADKTKHFTNSLRRTNVSALTKDLFKDNYRKAYSNGTKLASFIKSFSSVSPKHQSGGVSSISRITKSISASAVPKKSISSSYVISKLDHDFRVSSDQGRSPIVADTYRTDGVLTGQLSNELSRVNTMNTILNYDQPILTVKDETEIRDIGVVQKVRDMSSSFKLVELSEARLVGLLSLQKVWIKVKPGDKLKLGDDFFTVKIDGKNIQCYYRWYKIMVR